jgi:hypothetical protein
MPVDENNSIDLVAQRPTGEIELIISDHLEWDDSYGHQLILQTKLNAYLRFIESGELFEKFPAALNNPFYVDIVFQHEPDHDGYAFLDRVKAFFAEGGLLLTHRIFGAKKDTT